MASQSSDLHFVIFPLMSPGHMNPMADIARILAHHNAVIVTVVTTPHNAARYSATFAHFSQSGLPIRLAQLRFRYEDAAGIPEGCENFDMLPSLGMGLSFFESINKILLKRAEELFQQLTPQPNCIISDVGLPYTASIAKKFDIPRISFYGTSCFCLLGSLKAISYEGFEKIKDESEYFIISDLPDKIEVTKSQLPGPMKSWEEFDGKTAEAEMAVYGVIMNSFTELEPAYATEYTKIRKDKVWCIGPVSLSNKDDLAKAHRGNKASSDEHECREWLDLQKPRSVIYVCLGSMCNLTALQLKELGLALEESNIPFIWVMRAGNHSQELYNWIKEYKFEERTKGRSLLIRGWAPQVLILSHKAIGGFITHSGWNSTLEAICAGVPMLTWPLFEDQFLNEKFVVQVIGIGVKVGVESPMRWGEEDKIGVLVRKQEILMAIHKLMDETEEREERRNKAVRLSQMAKEAVEEGGFSELSVKQLIQDIRQLTKRD